MYRNEEEVQVNSMGDFSDHALPGSFLILFSLYWTVQMFNRYYCCRKRNAIYVSTATFPCTCLCGKASDWPIESCVKLVFASIGFVLEIHKGFEDEPFNVLNGHHATMIFFFGLSGLVELLVHYEAPLPDDIEYATGWLAFFVECILFKFHLHGRNYLDVLLHTLLVYTVYGNLISLSAEIKWRHNILISLSRCYFIFLQGTWLWQLSFILYPPYPAAEPWNPNDHNSVMIATMYYAYHCGAVFLIMLVIGGIVGFWHRKFGGDISYDDIAMKRLIQTGANGQTLISMNDESDSDIEFQKPAT